MKRYPDCFYRSATYKTTDKARRAFYRWCGKNDWIGPLVHDPDGRLLFGSDYYRKDYYGYQKGFPVFGVTRSTAMKLWEEEGREAYTTEWKKTDEREYQERIASRAAKEELELEKSKKLYAMFHNPICPELPRTTEANIRGWLMRGTSLTFDEIPSELVELQRLILIAKKELSHENNESTKRNPVRRNRQSSFKAKHTCAGQRNRQRCGKVPILNKTGTRLRQAKGRNPNLKSIGIANASGGRLNKIEVQSF